MDRNARKRRKRIGVGRSRVLRTLIALKREDRGRFRQLKRRKNRKELMAEIASAMYTPDQFEAAEMLFAEGPEKVFDAETMALFENIEWDGSFIDALMKLIEKWLPLLLKIVAFF